MPIVSAGSSGQVNVSVGGGNLLDTSVLQNGIALSFELISDNEIKLDVLMDGVYRQLKVFNMPIEEFKTSRTLYVKGNITSNSNPENIPVVVARLKNVNNENTNTYNLALNTSQNLEISNEATYVEFVICANGNNTAKAGDTLTIQDLMISAVEVPYQPYVEPQTLIVSTPNGLPGIPVTSGGNYTDADGQQWVCDEVDFARGVYVQRVGKTVVDGTEIKFTATSAGDYWNLPHQSAPGISEISIAISKYFPIGVFEGNIEYSFLFTVPTAMSQYFSIDELNAFCAEKYADGQPLEIYYIMAPIETDLTVEEIAAYKALHTYSPTTTVSNDANAWMKVGYKATP